jgi:hypothetical protein
MTADDDWRLTWEDDWHGAELQRKRFTAPAPDWDHEHCVLCQTKFMEETHPDTIQEGFVYGYDRSASAAPHDERRISVPDPPTGFSVVQSPNAEHWVCPTCFEDFEQRFHWTVADPPNDLSRT